MSVQNIFYSVIQASILGSVVGIIVYILKSTLLRKLPAKWQYIMWFIMILKLIFPNGPESKISIFNQMKVVNKMSETELLKISQTPTQITEAIQNTKSYSLADVLPYVWLVGFTIAFLWIITSFLILKYKIKSSSSSTTYKTEELLRCCQETVGVKKKIEIIVQNHINTTALYGFFKPKILITKDFENKDIKHIKYTFLHELSHYKRMDIAINYILLFLRCVHWFNPIIWFLFKKIRRDTELATDERAMSYLSPEEHKNYGMALISTLSLKPQKLPNMLGMANNKADITKRIKAVAKFKKSGILQHIYGILTMFLVSTVSLTSAVVAKPISNTIYNNIPILKTDNINIDEKNKFDSVNSNNSKEIHHYKKTVEKESVRKETLKSAEKANSQIENNFYTTETIIKQPENNSYTTETISKQSEINSCTDDIISKQPENNSNTDEIIDKQSQKNSCIEHEYMYIENLSIDSVIASTGQVIDYSEGTTDLNKNAKTITYNTDYDGSYSFKVNPNDGGYIQILIENEGFNHDVYIGVCRADSKGRGWDYSFNTKTKVPIHLDGYESNEEYVVTISCYCPGHYDINGRILVY